MARMTTTNQKKKTMMPGIAYPPTRLALATALSYPRPRDLCCGAAHAGQVDVEEPLPGVRSSAGDDVDQPAHGRR